MGFWFRTGFGVVGPAKYSKINATKEIRRHFKEFRGPER